MVEIKLPWQKGGEPSAKSYSEKERMLRLVIMILVPFYAVWGTFNFFFFMGYPSEWSVLTLVCGFCLWGTGIVVLMNQRQMEAQKYKCFRSLKWRMSVTDRIIADVYVDQKIEYLGRLGGYQAYKVHFPFGLFYMHPRLNDGQGVTFNKAYWLLPDVWEQTFFPMPEQEAWFGALPVTVEAEDATIHNLRWMPLKGEYIPVALVVDSNRHFEFTIGRVQMDEEENAPAVAQYLCQIASLVSENIDTKLELASEIQANKGLLKATDNIEALVRDMVQDIKRRHGDVKRMPTPSKWTKINWRAVTIICIALGIITLIGAVILHYW